MNGLSYHQKVAMINEQNSQSEQGGGGSFAGVIWLIEIFLSVVFGLGMLETFGSETLQSLKYSAIAAGVGGIIVYLILHKIPGIRWVMMGAMVLLWAFVAYSIGQIMIGDDHEGFHLVTHKGPYIGAAVAGLFRALMYR